MFFGSTLPFSQTRPIPRGQVSGGVAEMSTKGVLCPVLCISRARISPSLSPPIARSEKTTWKGLPSSMPDLYFAKALLPFVAVTMLSCWNPSLIASLTASLMCPDTSSAINIRGFCARKDVDNCTGVVVFCNHFLRQGGLTGIQRAAAL